MAEIARLPIDDILYDEDFNCRGKITPIDVLDLAKDISNHGLIQPIIVAPLPIGKAQATGKTYTLVAGFRRLMAHRINQSETVECIIRPDMADEARARFFNFSENVQREDLTVVQEANAVAKLMALGLTRKQVAHGIGKSESWVQVRIELLQLPEDVVRDAGFGIIKTGQIRELFSIFVVSNKRDDPDSPIRKAVRKIKEAKITGKSAVITPKKPKPDAKVLRTRSEMLNMIDHIRESVGNGLHTRTLAWAAGEITNNDLFGSIREHAEAIGAEYNMPTVL